MKSYLTLILSLIITAFLSQENKDYIIKLNKDTIFGKIKMDSKIKSVIYEENGRKIKYEAKDVLAVKIDTVFYESGSVRLKKLKGKHFVFLQKTIKGNLNLYEVNFKKTKFLLGAFGNDFIHLRWVYRAHDWIKSDLITVCFYKKENESMKSLSRSWKEKTKDCKLLLDKYNSKTAPWNPSPEETVRFYNSNCK